MDLNAAKLTLTLCTCWLLVDKLEHNVISESAPRDGLVQESEFRNKEFGSNRVRQDPVARSALVPEL